MTAHEKIIKASEATKAAQKAYTQAVMDAYPVGCRISVWLGRANIVATVQSHGSAQNAGYLYVQNDKTGKDRSLHVLSDTPTRLGV